MLNILLFYCSFQVNFDDTTIVLTEPMFNFQSVQDAVNEVLFEEYQFKAAHVTNGRSYDDAL